MFYHAKLELSGTPQYYYNYPKEKLEKEILIPFINGQVVTASRGNHTPIINMKSVTMLTVYKTPAALTKPPDKPIPAEFDTPAFEATECSAEIITEVKKAYTFPPANSILQMAFAPPKNEVFVIMKFDDKLLDSAYAGVIKPMIKAHGMECIRIDEIQDSGQITDQVLQHIATSKYILADMSGERPNCYYEAGFAHALGKPLILTIKKEDSIHFDLSGYRFIQWETEDELRQELEKRFEDMEAGKQA